MNKRKIVVALKELSAESRLISGSRTARGYLIDGIEEIVKELKSDIENTNDKIVGNLSLSINVDNREANRQIKILSERLDVINQQIDRAVEELENTRSKIKIGVEVND